MCGGAGALYVWTLATPDKNTRYTGSFNAGGLGEAVDTLLDKGTRLGIWAPRKALHMALHKWVEGGIGLDGVWGFGFRGPPRSVCVCVTASITNTNIATQNRLGQEKDTERLVKLYGAMPQQLGVPHTARYVFACI